MAVSFGNRLLPEPMRVWQSCVSQSLPVDWFGKPHSFACPRGRDPGRGWLLMQRGDLNNLDPTGFYGGYYDLTFAQGPSSVTLKNLVIVGAQCIIPSSRGNVGMPYLVEIADRRRLYQYLPLDAAYNVRQSPGGSYVTATENSGTPWTWDQMLEDIWNASSVLPTYPGLPFTPDGTPDGFSFFMSNGWLAIHYILDRLACSLVLNPLTDTFSIVRLGVSDSVETAAESTWDNTRLWDDDFIDPPWQRLPEKVRVVFRKGPPPIDGSDPFYKIDNVDPNGTQTGVVIGTVVTLQDDLPAVYDVPGGTLQNSSALISRATERTADFFRVWENAYSPRMRRVYKDSVNEPGFVPGSLLTEFSLEERGGGVKTTISRRPPVVDPLVAWQAPFPMVGYTACSGGTLNVGYNQVDMGGPR